MIKWRFTGGEETDTAEPLAVFLTPEQRRIRELEAEASQYTVLSDIVAELCPEALFNRIEAEFYRRIEEQSDE